MNVRLICTTLTALFLIPASLASTEQPASAADEFSQRMARVEEWELRVNERQPPDRVMDAVGVVPGMVIGEVGAGRGRYTMHLSRRVGDAGRIYANDIDAEALAFLDERCRRGEIANIETVLGAVDDPRFPEKSLDMIFMVWVFHMVDSPVPLLRSFGASLKPGARVVMIEPPPEEIQEEREEMSASGDDDVLPTVLTPRRMAEIAAQTGFKLEETTNDVLEKDMLYVLVRE